MQNSKLNFPTEELERLRIIVNSGKVTQEMVSIATGVHQSQVSRILSGNSRIASKNVLKLCKYSNHLHNLDPTRPQICPALIAAIEQVWDGTPAHADAIAKVILSLEDLSVKRDSIL